MTAEQIIFLIVGAVTLASALMVVTARDLVHAALWLVATLFGVAIVYTLLNAGFLAVVQVVVYIGAILAVLTFGGLVALLQTWSGFTKTASVIPSGFDAVNELGTALTSPAGYVLPFEVASVLLLAALVGAVYLAFSKK